MLYATVSAIFSQIPPAAILFRKYLNGTPPANIPFQVTDQAFAHGFAFRQSGAKVPKSTIHKILTNPLYHGEFIWSGKRYKGTHEPIISKERFDRVQQV